MAYIEERLKKMEFNEEWERWAEAERDLVQLSSLDPSGFPNLRKKLIESSDINTKLATYSGAIAGTVAGGIGGVISLIGMEFYFKSALYTPVPEVIIFMLPISTLTGAIIGRGIKKWKKRKEAERTEELLEKLGVVHCLYATDIES